MEDVLRDKRFAHITKDPRFRRMPRGERKVKIDSRFKDMFNDKRFKLKYSVDKRGRPVNLTTNENLKKFYDISDGDSSEDDDAASDGDSSEDDDAASDGEDRGTKAIAETGDGDIDSDENGSEDDTNIETEESDHSDDDDDDDYGSGKQISKNSKLCNTDPRFQVLKSNEKTSKNKVNKKVKEIPAKTNSGKKAMKKKAKMEKSSSAKNKSRIKNEDNSSDESEEEKEDLGLVKGPSSVDSGIDFARGEGNLSSSSSEDEDDDEEEDTELDHHWGEVDPNVTEVSEATHRLAACNLDWDRIKAKDIFVLLNSFKPVKGIITSVKIYPSEFGKERMEEEQSQGPRVLTDSKQERDDEDSVVDKDGNEYHTEKLRQYQLERLKYYYAVIDCDSLATADQIYTECDGMEYETSSTKMDLRYIPDDMIFDEEPASLCTEIPPEYNPLPFVNSALSRSKVDLTWDETDRERVQLTSQQFSNKPEDIKEDDLKAYIASSSDEEGPSYGDLVDQSDDESDDGDENTEDKQIDKYKLLLTELDKEESKKKDNDVQMEITWELGLKGATQDLIKKKKQSKELTPWEEYLEKKKEKRKKKRGDKKNKQKSDDDDDADDDDNSGSDDEQDNIGDADQAFSDDDLPGNIDMNDPFFAEEMKSRDQTKKDKKKKKKKKEKTPITDEDKKEQDELSLLIMDENAEQKKHFNLKKLVDDGKQKKKKNRKNKDRTDKKKEDNFQVNVADPRFTAMYDSHLFNIDPSVPEFKKTKGTEAIIAEKLKRSDTKGKKKRSNMDKQTEVVKKRKMEESTKVDESLASLVKSVKSKTKHFHNNKIKR